MTNTQPKVGTIRIGDAAEYEGRTGFVVEQFTYGNSDEPSWCVPGWVEDRWGEDGSSRPKPKRATSSKWPPPSPHTSTHQPCPIKGDDIRGRLE